jgi:hypothetical protein
MSFKSCRLGKSRWLGAISVAGLVLAATFSAPAVTPASAADAAAPLKCASNPLIGTWRLNIAKSNITRNNGQINGRIVFITPYGKDGISYVFMDDDDKRASAREETWLVQFDGKPHPTEGGDPRLLSWKRIDCNTFEMITLRQLVMNKDGTVKEYYPEGQAQSHSRIVASPDGKTYTTTHSGQLGGGQRYDNEILVFDRL